MITPFFHIGLIVAEFGEARRELSSTLGFTWRPEARIVSRVRANGGAPVDREFSVVYSNEGPPHVELIAAGDAPWDMREGVHHVGMYTEDLAADIAILQGQNYREVASGADAMGRLDQFAYLASPTGVILELIDIKLQAS
jgi:hypothetical protein